MRLALTVLTEFIIAQHRIPSENDLWVRKAACVNSQVCAHPYLCVSLATSEETNHNGAAHWVHPTKAENSEAAVLSAELARAGGWAEQFFYCLCAK